MTRAKLVSNVLWSTLAVAACGDDGFRRLADTPPGPQAAFPTTLALSATCGDPAPAAADLAIQNTGTEALVISAAAATGNFTVATQLPLTIAPGASGTLTIRPPLSVIGTDVGGSVKAGVLTLTTNEAEQPPTVALGATVQGAQLAYVNAANQPVPLAFSGTSGTCPAPLATFLRNVGTMPVTLSAPSSPTFAFSGFSGGVLAPGVSAEQQIAVFTLGPCSGDSGISYQATGTLCNGNGDSTGGTYAVAATFTISDSSSCFCS